MKFRVSRTSDWSGSGEPIDGAFREPESDRELERMWAIEIPDLAALVALARKERLIISADDDGTQQIEVYDDYRE